MRSILKTFANAALIVVGFFAVFFAAAKFIGGNQSGTPVAGDSPDLETDDLDVGVAHADVPPAG